MNQGKQLAARFREVFIDGKWIANTNFKELLSDVTWEEANQKIGTLNTIHALTFHCNYYLEGVLNFLKAGKLEIQDKYSFDYPEIKSEEEWKEIVNEMVGNASQFSSILEQFTEEDMEKTFVHEKYGNFRRNMNSLIEHSYYHMGQISLIKKMIREKTIDNPTIN